VAAVAGRTPYPWYKKINPIWWLQGDQGWTVPTVNNGAPYLPNVTNPILRAICWFTRNPLMNFVGYVIGVNDRNYAVVGSPQVQCVTGRDTTPPTMGWRWSYIKLPEGRLPYCNYYNGKVEFYLGWRPQGGLGLKLVFHSNA
jgi:hypothetical protein